MEESIKYLKEQFELGELDIRTCSPVVLAYIGDAVYELVIRTVLVCRGGRQANTLHKRASSYVKASAQAAMIEALQVKVLESLKSVFGIATVSRVDVVMARGKPVRTTF